MKLLAIDSNSILNRAFYGVRPLTTREGLFTNGIFGFMNIFFKLLDELHPDAVVFAFDLRAPTFRHKMYSGYKAQRKGMPEELAQQVQPLKDIISLMGYPIISIEGFEADDILGTLAARCCASGNECIIATGDRDSFQLVGDCVTVRLAFTRGGQSGAEMIDTTAINERYGVSPKQLIDVKSLMGDSSDNIPGVAGIGEKTALSLIRKFGSLDGVYEHIDDPAIKKGVREKLLNDKEMAYQSRALAEINCAAPIEATLDELLPSPRKDDELFSLLHRLELKTVIGRLFTSAPAEAVNNAMSDRLYDGVPYIKVYHNDAAAARSVFDDEKLFAKITFENDIPVSAAVMGEKLVLLDSGCPELKAIVKELAAFSQKLSIPNCKEWLRYLYKNGIEADVVKFDPVLAGYLISPLSSDYSFESLTAGRNVYGPPYVPNFELAESQKPLLNEMLSLPDLCTQLANELERKEMDKLIYEIELPLARVLASIETIGFELDSEGLRNFGVELDSEISELTQRIYYLAGGSFNINSPKQLGEVLFDRLGLPAKKKTKSGYSTSADVLDELRPKHPIIEDILTYRKLAKLKSTYVEGLLAQLDDDGRVRSIFRQTETRTGRISSTEPNLQNIPVRTELGSRMRRFFVAPEGYKLVDADYSQIELRVLAHIANDKAMISAFMSGEDIHTKTAAQVFDMPEAFVTPQMRSSAKAVNFGIVYGIGAFSLSQDIGVSVAEADRYIKNYLATYKGVAQYMKDSIEFGKEHGYVKTLFNRRRPLPELTTGNRVTKAFGERVAMNTPIQGTAADIIKLAMVKVFERLKAEGMRSRLILQVHDELIVEAPIDEAEKAAAILKEEMEGAAQFAVTLTADANIGDNWLDAK